MSGLLIFIVISLVLAPLLKVASRANRAAPPKPNPWDEIEWEESDPEQEELPTDDFGYQSLDIAPMEEGERSILPPLVQEAQEQPIHIERSVNTFDLQAAVVADAVLNAKYKDEQ